MSRDERITAIKAAARKVFRAEGYSGARMQLIAAGCGVTVGTIYNYFKDKEALFQELLAEDLAVARDPVEERDIVASYLPFPCPVLPSARIPA